MKSRDILHPKKKKAKHLFSGKSYNDLSLMAESTLSEATAHSPEVVRSHSFGSSTAQVAAHRLSFGASYPHDANAYELINKCGHGATAEVRHTLQQQCPFDCITSQTLMATR